MSDVKYFFALAILAFSAPSLAGESRLSSYAAYRIQASDLACAATEVAREVPVERDDRRSGCHIEPGGVLRVISTGGVGSRAIAIYQSASSGIEGECQDNEIIWLDRERIALAQRAVENAPALAQQTLQARANERATQIHERTCKSLKSVPEVTAAREQPSLPTAIDPTRAGG